MATKKAAPKKAVKPMKKAVKKAPAKKPAKKGVPKGAKFGCRVCGMEVTVNRACGCASVHPLVCCGKPMQAKKSA